MTTDPRHAEARRLRGETDLSLREIGTQLGVSAPTIYRWTTPRADERGRVLSRANKRRYAGECIDCGDPTNGSAGPGRAGQRCSRCHAEHLAAAATWTPDRLIAEACRWYRLTGLWPTSADWAHPTTGTGTREVLWQATLDFRALTGPWPLSATVRHRFDDWPAFMAACGGTTVGPGGPRRPRGEQHPRLIALRAAIQRITDQEATA